MLYITQYAYIMVEYESNRDRRKKAGVIMAIDREKQYRRQNAFNAERYDRFNVNLPKGMKSQIIMASGVCGMKTSEFIRQAIQNEISRLRFRYGMRLRGFSPGCQPKDGFIDRQDDDTGKYYDILIYNRPLTEKEVADYELDYLGGGL